MKCAALPGGAGGGRAGWGNRPRAPLAKSGATCQLEGSEPWRRETGGGRGPMEQRQAERLSHGPLEGLTLASVRLAGRPEERNAAHEEGWAGMSVCVGRGADSGGTAGAGDGDAEVRRRAVRHNQAVEPQQAPACRQHRGHQLRHSLAGKEGERIGRGRGWVRAIAVQSRVAHGPVDGVGGFVERRPGKLEEEGRGSGRGGPQRSTRGRASRAPCVCARFSSCVLCAHVSSLDRLT
jgi:hypothetical protein